MSSLLFAIVLVIVILIVVWSVSAEKANQEGSVGGLFQMKDDDDLL